MSTSIPSPTVADPEHQGHIDAVVQILEQITGQQPNAAPLKPLAPGATLDDLISAVNTLIARVS